MAGNAGPVMFMGLAPMPSAITGWVMRFVPLAQPFAASGVCWSPPRLSPGVPRACVPSPMSMRARA